MFYFDLILFQCLIPFLLAFGAIAVAFVLSRPPMKWFSVKVAVPTAAGIVVFILATSTYEVVESGRYILFLSKGFGIAGMITAFLLRAHLTLKTVSAPRSNLPSHGKCNSCLIHAKQIWGPLPQYPKSLFRIDNKYGLSLLECQTCGGLWVHYAFSPEKKFPYLAQWNFGTKTWMQMKKVDRGIPILNWFSIEIKRCFAKLHGEEALQVELHRKCTQFQNNPVDSFVPPPTFLEVPT